MTFKEHFLATYQDHHQYPKNAFFAHELSEEPLVNYLSRISGSDSPRPFNADDLSKLFRSALKDRFSSDITDNLVSKTLNEWEIMGFINYYDVPTNTIAIPAILSTNRITEITTQGKDNKFAIQLAVLNYLFNKQSNLVVLAIDRLFSHYRTMSTDLLNFIEITDSYSPAEIEQLLITRTDKLKKHLDTMSSPERCTNIKWHKRQGKSINLTCTKYCIVKDHCKHKPTNYTAPSIIF